MDSGMVQGGVSPAPRAATSGFWSLPNLLTYGRIIAIPALVACFFATGDWGRWTAMWIFIAAGFSDFLDGYLARAWQQQSAIGRMLDPIADKLIVAAALLMLAADQTIAGYNIRSWSDGNFTYVAVSDLPVADLKAFENAFSAASPAPEIK